jgi:leader peptidase (prepilin peptidase) / N-methyltransferase
VDLFYFFAGATFLFGLLFGSFLNVCIYRLPRGLSVVSPRSACPACEAPIAAYDNVPVLSWLILGGKCRKCRTRITPRYAIVELLCGLLFLCVYLHFGPTLETLKYCVFSFLILGLVFTDAETHLLPDKMTLTGLGIALVLALIVAVPGLLGRYFPDAFSAMPDVGWRVLSLGDAVLGAAIGAGFIWLAGEVYLRVRGLEGMGFGDVKLMAMVGAFLGMKLTLFVLFGASLLGGIYGILVLLVVFSKRLRRYRGSRSRNAGSLAWNSASLALRHLELPFGVFLGGMSLLALFFGDNLLSWYVGLYR